MQNQPVEQVLMQTKSFNSNDINSVNADVEVGNIKVIGDAANQATVELYAWGNNGKVLSKEAIQQILDKENDFSIAVVNGSLTVREMLKVKNNKLSLSFVIHVKENTATDLSTSAGNIVLASLRGKQQFSTSGGNLAISNVSGSVYGETSGGNIAVNNSSADMRIRTSGGNVALKNLSGVVDARTSGGNIKADFKTLVKNVSLSTSGGSIVATISKNTPVNLNLKGNSVNTDALVGFDGNVQKDYGTNTVIGTLNGGGVMLTARAVGGGIYLKLK